MRRAGLPPMLVTRETSGSVDGGRLIHGYMTEERAKAPAMVLAPRMQCCSASLIGHDLSDSQADSPGRPDLQRDGGLYRGGPATSPAWLYKAPRRPTRKPRAEAQPVGLGADGAAVCLPGCCTFVLYSPYQCSKNCREGGI